MGSKQYWENHSLDRDSLFNQSLIQCPGGSNLFFLRLVLVSRFVSVIYCDQAFSFWMVTNNVTSVEAIFRGWVSVLILEIRRRSRSSVFFKFIKRSWSRQVHQTSFFIWSFLTHFLEPFGQSQNLKTVFISRTWPSQVLTCLEISYPENKKSLEINTKNPALNPQRDRSAKTQP